MQKSRSAAIPALAHELWQRAHPAPPAPYTQPTPPTNTIMGALLLAHGGTPPSPTAPSPGSAKATGLAALVPLGVSQAAEAGPTRAAVHTAAKAPSSTVASKSKVSGAKGREEKGDTVPERKDNPAGTEARAEPAIIQDGSAEAAESLSKDAEGPAKDAEDPAGGVKNLASDAEGPAEDAKVDCKQAEAERPSKKPKKGLGGSLSKERMASGKGSKGEAGKAATAAPPRFSRHRSDTLDNAAASTSFLPADPEPRKRRRVAPSETAPSAEAGSDSKQGAAVDGGSNGAAVEAEAAAGRGEKLDETLPAKLRHKAARLGKCSTLLAVKPEGPPSSAAKPPSSAAKAVPAHEAGKAAPKSQEAVKKVQPVVKKVQPAGKKVQPAEKAPRPNKQQSPKKVDLGAAVKGSPISKAEQEELDRVLALSLSAAPTARSTRCGPCMAADQPLMSNAWPLLLR